MAQPKPLFAAQCYECGNQILVTKQDLYKQCGYCLQVIDIDWKAFEDDKPGLEPEDYDEDGNLIVSGRKVTPEDL